MGRRRGGTRAWNTASKFRDKERTYELGRRNPNTLYGEPHWENRARSHTWEAARKWAASHAAVGAKYI